MEKAAFDSRSAVGAVAVWLALAPVASAQTYPQYNADGGGGSSRGGCTTIAAGGVNAAAPVVYEETCTNASGSAGSSQGAVAAAAHSTALGNSVDVIQNSAGTFRDQLVFTSTDPNATSAMVRLNVDFVTRLHAGSASSTGITYGSVALSGFGSGGLAQFQVSLNSDPNLVVDESQ